MTESEMPPKPDIPETTVIPPPKPSGPQAVSIDTRRTALQAEVSKYVRDGYRVQSQTDTTAQLIKPKKFSWLIFLVLLLIVGFGIIYLIYYLVKKDKAVYLTVDEFGKVSKQG